MEPVTYAREQALVEGTLVRRYARFLSDVRLADGRIVVAHCVNTGTMEGLTRAGTRVWLSESDNPSRKLKHTWELAEIEGVLIGVNTSLPNRMVGRLLRENRLDWLADWEEIVPEKVYGDRRRVDFWLRKGRREVFLEVKNCHLVYPDRRAYFPDSVSERATHHLRELAALRTTRRRGEVLFCCQMPEAKSVRPSDVHDPDFAAAARAAKAAGVRFSAIVLSQTPESITFERRIPVDLKPYATERLQAWKKRNRAQ